LALEVILMSGRTIDQGASLEGGKLGDPAILGTGVAFMDPEDLKAINLMTGSPVKVSTNHGEVIVRARASPDAPHKGIVFIPMGIYANAVIDPGTDDTGMPSYKNIPARVEPADGGIVLTPAEMARKLGQVK